MCPSPSVAYLIHTNTAAVRARDEPIRNELDVAARTRAMRSPRGVIVRDIYYLDSLASPAVGIRAARAYGLVSVTSSSRWYTRSVPVQLPCDTRASRVSPPHINVSHAYFRIGNVNLRFSIICR